jgi:ADP-heptose:LPS heptosyltransferase
VSLRRVPGILGGELPRNPTVSQLPPAEPVGPSTTALPVPPGRLASRWDVLRRRVVARCFAGLFGGVGRDLCEPGQLPAQGIYRVLICRPNHRLGNALLISPLLAEVEALYPGAEIDIITGGHAASMLFAHRFQLGRIFSLPPRIARHLWFSASLLRALRGKSYDLAIDACDGSQSGRLLLAMVRARYKVGLPDELVNPHSAWHALVRPEHFAQRGVYLLRMARSGVSAPPYPPLSLPLTTAELHEGKAMLARVLGEPAASAVPAGAGAADTRPVLGLFANATGAKRYDTAWWRSFVAALQGLRPDWRIVDLVADHGRSQLDDAFAAYYTRDLRRLGGVIANLDAYISGDCGVMHLAAACGTPTLGLFSVTSASKYGPYGPGNLALDTRRLDAAQVAAVAAPWLDQARRAR